MKKDIEIQKDVMEELNWIPLLRANEIGVSVKNGVVTLTGLVDSYPQKIQAERSVSKIAGVRGIADEIEVRIPDKDLKTDSAIAQAVMHELEWHSNLDIDRISILVDHGVVTLEGNVDWDFQRKSAAKAVSALKGVNRIINNIKIARQPVTGELKDKIKSALKRHATIDADNIKVEVDGNKVILSGTVSSWPEKLDAEESVWSAPGVTRIENHIVCDDELF
ncbi:MAG: BON domain-containing protein [Bacteroidia bacterium]